jgi:hypothetical protein
VNLSPTHNQNRSNAGDSPNSAIRLVLTALQSTPYHTDPTSNALSAAHPPRNVVSQEEVIERAKRDQGDDDDLVLIREQHKSRGHIYHEDPDCSHLVADSTVEYTRRQAQNRGYGPCKICTLETANMSKTGTRPTDLIETVRQKMADE